MISSIVATHIDKSLMTSFFPKVNGGPSSLHQQLVVPKVTSHVFFDFFDPIFTIPLKPFLSGFPVFPVPKLAIYKDSDMVF